MISIVAIALAAVQGTPQAEAGTAARRYSSYSIAEAGAEARPYPPYWQQQVGYEITAALDEPRGVLSGAERIHYVNRSPDTLTTFALHLHLNAFRPGSRWADADSVERRRRFNDLKDPDYAFDHVRNVRIMGQPVEAVWPVAPDSTIVRFLLPKPLAPGDSMLVEMDWDARPSTVPRRQGRRGRHFDFAQWYPKVVVYDTHGWQEHPLYPGGEFYGEFATYLFEFDVPDDQVLAATGVPLCGDPGWERANQVPDRPVQYRRDFYPNAPRYRAEGKDCLAAQPIGPVAPLAAGRKRVVWYAEDVHHVALTMNPEYRYEGGAWGNVAIHVLWRPGDEESWGHGVAVQRTAKALAWLDGFFGHFAWPQISNIHRIDGGGTEFPMMIHDGSASQGLIVHELGHNYVMGILANNEWREGWLDEGFTSFQTSLFDEAERPGTDAFSQDEPYITGLDLDGMGEPASLPGEDYDDFASYNTSIYTRGELFFHQLRYIVGDAALGRIMHTYYDRWQLKHVDEAAFRAVAEEVSGQDLSGFFAQGLHGTALVDYAVGGVKISRTNAGAAGGSAGWQTRVEVRRVAEGRIPVEVWVIGESDTAVVRTDGQAVREWATIVTRSRPKEVLLDPRLRTRDWNMLNNVWRRSWLRPVRSPKFENYADTWFTERVARDHRTRGISPTVWYNDAGGITLGFRTRENYFGRFEENINQQNYSTGWATDGKAKDMDFLMRLRNPVKLQHPGMSQQLDLYDIEGRFGASLALDWARRDHLGYGGRRNWGVQLTWLQPDDFRYLDRGYYDDAGTVELELHTGAQDRRGPWTLASELRGGGGLAYNKRGLAAATGRTALDQFYGRASLTTTATRPLGTHAGLRLRFFTAISTSGDQTVKQRQVYLSGADPQEQFTSPFLRSNGALFVRPDLYYQAPGGGMLRGFDPHLSAEGVVALNVEIERMLLSRPKAKLFRRVRLAAFGDAGHTIGDSFTPSSGGQLRWLADAGVGVRADHLIGATAFTTRLDLPLYVSRPTLAQDRDPGSDRVGFRWTFAFQPSW